jgi:hypothetical protein
MLTKLAIKKQGKIICKKLGFRILSFHVNYHLKTGAILAQVTKLPRKADSLVTKQPISLGGHFFINK